MKIWVRLVIGILIGVALSVFLPVKDSAVLGFFSTASNFVIHIGRYLVFPFVFFSLALGVFRLRGERKLLSVYARTGIYIIVSTLALIIIGTLTFLVLIPDRIPVFPVTDAPIDFPGVPLIFSELFPKNLFLVFTGAGNFLLPVFLLSIFIGITFSYNKVAAEPTVLLFDSLSRIFYSLNRVVTEIIGIGFIFLTTFLILQIRSVVELELFVQLSVILAVDAAIIIFILFPVLIYFLCDKKNPYLWLYSIAGPALTGFISGDGYFSLGMLIRHGKENLGIPRRVGSTTFPLIAVMGHAGTAMVACIGYLVILRSYSSLEIPLPMVLLTMFFSFAISFLLGMVPGKAAFIAIALLSSISPDPERYLILKPIAPLLICMGALLDVVTSAFISTVVAHQEDMSRDVELHDYI